jgi:hypothetical protein
MLSGLCLLLCSTFSHTARCPIAAPTQRGMSLLLHALCLSSRVMLPLSPPPSFHPITFTLGLLPPPLIIKSLPDIKANLLMLSAAPPSKPKDGYDEVGSLEQCLVHDEERRGAMLTVGVCLPSAGTWGPDSRRVCRPGCGQQCGRWVEQQRRGTKHGSSPGIVKAPKPHACFGSVRRPIGAFKPLTGFVSELFGSKFNYTFNHTDIRELITL